jgi:hypothetical protein
MAQKTWSVAAIILLLAMLVGLLVSVLIGDCKELIDCGDSQIPMKCHWTYTATAIIYVLGSVAAAAQLLFKTTEGRRASIIAPLFLAAAAAIITSPVGIGTCAMEMSNCHITAYIVWAVTAVVLVISIIQFTKANPDDASKPKFTD